MSNFETAASLCIWLPHPSPRALMWTLSRSTTSNKKRPRCEFLHRDPSAEAHRWDQSWWVVWLGHEFEIRASQLGTAPSAP